MIRSWRHFSGYGAPLLVAYEYGSTGYQIYLTDLTSLWKEILDRRGIIKQSFALDTSIDPSEDASQMQMLLSSIQQALEQHHGATAHFSPPQNGEVIRMSLTAPLPHPLKPLKWEASLKKCPMSEFVSVFMIPLLLETSAMHEQVSSLKNLLSEKDKVLGKVLDQVHADGVDLGKTFPGVAAARGNKHANFRDSLGRSVKGMTAFNEHAWEQSLDSKLESPSDFASLFNLVSPMTMRHNHAIYNPPDISWWRKLGTQENNTVIEDSIEQSPSTQKGDYPTQSSPSHFTDHANKPAQEGKDGQNKGVEADDESTTDDESVEYLKTQSPKHASERTVPVVNEKPTVESEKHQPVRKLGKIGGKGSQRQSAEPAAPSTPRRLGKIGGGSKAGSKSDAKDEESSTLPAHGGMEKDPEAASSPDTNRGRQDKQIRSPQSPRETSVERANKNRERLKRELDDKGKHAKKKRKF